MNTNYPHEIIPARQLAPAPRRSYPPLTEAELALLAPMTREKRSAWLRSQGRADETEQAVALRQLYDALEAARAH